MSRPSTIVIVGAGPYGLSVAAHLRRHGLPFRIFGSPMQTWSNMPGGMFLKSEGRASNLSDSAGSYTLKAHCEQYGLSYGEYGVPVPLETFVDYGLKFQQRLVPEVEDTRVLALRRSAHGYELQTATGELLAAKSVVVAVGISHFRHIPRRLAHLPRELVSHTSHHQSFAAFSGRDLTVIGGGQSALETAALAREQGANVRVLVRQPRLVWNGAPHQEPRRTAQRLRCPTTGLGDGWRLRFYANSPGAFHRLPERMRVRAVRTALGPAGAWWLKERVLGQLPVLTGHTVVSASADGNRVRLRVQRGDGRVIDQTTEHLIAGTGYRVDLSRLSFLGEQLRGRLRLAAGAPALSSSFEASAPDLYFVGLASAYSFGPAMRFLHGADYSARRLVSHLLARAAGATSLALPTLR
jgi:cation diffusion facilitator CzcD-associated flavoprotein CzcO